MKTRPSANTYEANPKAPALDVTRLDETVISHVVNPDGSIRVLSKFTDDIWQLWPHFAQSNRTNAETEIHWLKVPECFRRQVKNIILHYWRYGRPRTQKPVAGTVRDAVVRLVPFLEFLKQSGVNSLGSIRPIHLHSFIQDLKKNVAFAGRKNCLGSIDLLQTFSHCNEDRISFELWPNSSPAKMAGPDPRTSNNGFSCSATPIIPDSVLNTLIDHAIAIIENADIVLTEREALLDESGNDSLLRRPGKDVMAIRNACFFLVGILTGMRCDEIVGIEVGGTRDGKILGVEVNWISSFENKTKKGNVHYLSGPLGSQVVRLMERWSKPYRLEMARQIERLQEQGSLADKDIKELETLKKYQFKIFLSSTGRSTLSGRVWGRELKAMSNDAGVDWDLSPHQLRRTFARLFVRHRYGNILMLKEQFQHTTLGISQLYGSSPMQDFEIFEEISLELKACNMEIIDGWLNDSTPLSGGAGRKIINIRCHPFQDRESMIQDTAGKVSIRSTGHSWCLSQEQRGCGGRGIYEVDLCCDCKESVIDESFFQVWQGILAHQKELRACASNMSSGIQERIERDILKTQTLLSELKGREPPSTPRSD